MITALVLSGAAAALIAFAVPLATAAACELLDGETIGTTAPRRVEAGRGEADGTHVLRFLLTLARPLPRKRLALLHGRRAAW